jgi:hypothetical protein
VNDRDAGRSRIRRVRATLFVRVWGEPARVTIVNNLFVGPGRVLHGAGEVGANLQSDAPGLVDRMNFDYRHAPGSPAIDAGIDPGAADGVSRVPVAHSVHRAGEEPRATRGRTDLGAYEAAAPRAG